jgi:hypothetical protein
VHVELRNRRPHALAGVRLDQPPLALGPFAPGEARTVELPVSQLPAGPRPRLRARYTTHRGLGAQSVVELPLPLAAERPVVLGDDFTEQGSEGQTTRGTLVDARELDVVLPPGWKSARVNGTIVAASGAGRLRVPLAGPRQAVRDLEVAGGSGVFRPFDAHEVLGGLHVVRFKLPALPPGRHVLVLSGLGTERVVLRIRGRERVLATHSYRDMLVDLTPEDANATVEMLIDRQKILYVPREVAPDGREVSVWLEAPVVYSEQSVEIGP